MQHMYHRTALLMTWLEEEGQRRRRRFPLPSRVGDPAVRGWVHVAVCLLGGTLAAGLFLCWLARTWEGAIRVGAGAAMMASERGERSMSIKLEGVRVEGISWQIKGPGARRTLYLMVRYKDLLLECEFAEEKAPLGIWVGDSVTILSASGRDEQDRERALLKDCELLDGPISPEQ
jgi:hypothetical protein